MLQVRFRRTRTAFRLQLSISSSGHQFGGRTLHNSARRKNQNTQLTNLSRGHSRDQCKKPSKKQHCPKKKTKKKKSYHNLKICSYQHLVRKSNVVALDNPCIYQARLSREHKFICRQFFLS